VNILLDHCVDCRLRRFLKAHHIMTTAEMGWQKLRNGKLLATAASQFDALLTVDQNLKYQQKLATLPIAVVVMVAHTNKLVDLIPLVPYVEEALKLLRPCTLVEVRLPSP